MAVTMEKERKIITQRPRRIIYNDDGVDAQKKTPEEFINMRLRQLVDTQVDTVTFDVFSSDNVAAYPSKVVQIAGPPSHPYTMLQSGHDPLAIAVKYCHGHGIEFFASFRMNDIHESMPDNNRRRIADWKRQHPDYLLGRETDWERYPWSSPRKWWAAKDYAVAEVRDRQFQVIEEICHNYDVDGIELDWWRSPLFFRPTLDLQPAENEHRDIMTEFVRKIRNTTEQAGRQRNRPIIIACRIPMSVQRCRDIGLDVERWLKEDLFDIMILSGGYVPKAMAPSVRRMAQFGHRFDVPVYACISASFMREQYASNEAWRGAAMNVWQAGADGIYTFNLFPQESDPRYSQMGSPETLKGLDKIYAVDYIVENQLEGDLRPGLVAPGRLPVELQLDAWIGVNLPIGEDLAANAPAGKEAHTELSLRFAGMVAGDQVTVTINDNQFAEVAPTDLADHKSDSAEVRLKIDPHLLQSGDNEVRIYLKSMRVPVFPTPEVRVVLEQLDLYLKYE